MRKREEYSEGGRVVREKERGKKGRKKEREKEIVGKRG